MSVSAKAVTKETPTRLIQRAYRTELRPSSAQRVRLVQHAGACRFVFNWALAQKFEAQAQWQAARDAILAATVTALGPAADEAETERRRREANREAGARVSMPTAMGGLNRALTELKRSDAPWLYEISTAAAQNAIRNADTAFANHFRRLQQGQHGRKAGQPRYKSRKRGIGSFKLNGTIRVGETTIQLPVIGTVRLKERGYLPTDGVRITSATVSEQAGRWYVALQVEEMIPDTRHDGGAVGVHLGVRKLATLSTGEVIENPKALERRLHKLRRAQRALARKQRGSNNREKQKRRVARVHQRVANVRRESIHRATHAIAKRYGTVIVQDFGVRDMLEDARHATRHRLARLISDAAMGKFRRQLAYKTDWLGGRLVLVERSFPASRRCSQCGNVKEHFPLAEEIYRCGLCGLELDRDHNAAQNLIIVAVKSPETLNACLTE